MSPVAAQHPSSSTRLVRAVAGSCLAIVAACATSAFAQGAEATEGVVQRVARLDPSAATAGAGARVRGAPATAHAATAAAGPCRLAWTDHGSRLACGDAAFGAVGAFAAPKPVDADDPLLRIAEADADVAMALRSLHRVDGDLFGMDGGEVAVRSVGRERTLDLLREPDATRRSSPALPGEARFNVDVAWSHADRSVATIRLRPLAGNPRQASGGAVVDYVRAEDGRYRLAHWRLL